MDDQKGLVLNKGEAESKCSGWNTPGPGRILWGMALLSKRYICICIYMTTIYIYKYIHINMYNVYICIYMTIYIVYIKFS